ncbi:MAG: hypothetical protein WBN66_08175 [Smithella sp.]
MKICKLCQREFEDDLSLEVSPAEEVGDLFLESCANDENNDICPECKENEGMLILLGFNQ